MAIDGLEDKAAALAAHEHLAPLESESLWQTNSLTPAIPEELGP